MIVLTRVDNRLIHGQVVQSWLPSLDVSEVLIVSPIAQKKEFIKKMLRLALPSGYKLTVLSAKEAKKYSEESQEKLFIIIEDTENLFEMLEEGFSPKIIILGNTQFRDGKKQYSQGVFLDDNEVKKLKKLEIERHISVEIRSLPSSFATKL
ncbi:MAG: PTS sugar transporter subunit IIB [Elusimicrobiaceae bacterium]|nr:PTS sugar transporter subunit IIB [Elusimicrobiaceae bacterium]